VKVVINLMTGGEDPDRLSYAFLTAIAAQKSGKQVTMICTQEAVRVGVEGYADAIEAEGAPPMAKLLSNFGEHGGELLLCPISFKARELDEGALVPHARIGGATPMWDWVGDDPAVVFSY
jgi:predicted peroxiredoxin